MSKDPNDQQQLYQLVELYRQNMRASWTGAKLQSYSQFESKWPEYVSRNRNNVLTAYQHVFFY